MLASTWIPLLTVVIGLLGGIFAAMRFNRQDAKTIVETQSTVISDIKTVNDELVEATVRIRAERDDLQKEVTQCSQLVKILQNEVQQLRDDLQINSDLAKTTIIGLEKEVNRLSIYVRQWIQSDKPY